MKLITTTALIISLATASFAGGPVLITEEPETAPDRKIGGLVIGIIAIAAIIALANGGGHCTTEETPEPTPPSGGC